MEKEKKEDDVVVLDDENEIEVWNIILTLPTAQNNKKIQPFFGQQKNNF